MIFSFLLVLECSIERDWTKLCAVQIWKQDKDDTIPFQSVSLLTKIIQNQHNSVLWMIFFLWDNLLSEKLFLCRQQWPWCKVKIQCFCSKVTWEMKSTLTIWTQHKKITQKTLKLAFYMCGEFNISVISFGNIYSVLMNLASLCKPFKKTSESSMEVI